MRELLTCLGLAALVALAGCSKKVTDEKAKSVQPGMTRAEVETALGSSGRKADGGAYEWDTEKGKLRVTFDGDKVTRIETVGGGAAPKEMTAQEKADRDAEHKAATEARKKELDQMMKDRDRVNDLNQVHALLVAAVGIGDKLPASEAVAAASPLAEVNGGMAAIRAGRVVVRWGAPITDAVWAYEKDAPIKGGYVVGEKYRLAEKLTAEQLKPFVKP